MSIMTSMIEKAETLGGLLTAHDFSLTDGENQSTSVAGSVATTITFSSVTQVADDGVVLSESQTGSFTGDLGGTDVHFLWVFKSEVADFTLFRFSDTWPMIQSVEALQPKFYFKSAYSNGQYTINHSGTIELNKVQLVGFYGDAYGRPALISLELGTVAETEITRDETTVNEGHYRNINKGTLFTDFVGLASGLVVFDRQLSENELNELLDTINIYGVISIPTNLNQERAQSGTILLPDRTVNTNFKVAAGSQTLEAYSLATKGDLLEFVAFDSDAGGSIYKTQPVDPSIVTELYFESILGGSDGGSNQTAKVSGVVQIDGTPAQRTVRAFSYDPTLHEIDGANVDLSKSLGHAVSDPETGDYTIYLLGGYDKRIFVVAFDDYGDDFTPDMTVAAGDRVHPTTPNGYVWECTGAGTLPTEEPAWIIDEDTAQLYGTASMIAKPFYRPMVHGPVTPEVTTLETPWTPAEIQTVLWLDASDETTLTVSGGYVQAWNDKSGRGITFHATSASTGPVVVQNGLNSLPVLYSNGIDTSMDAPDPIVSGADDRYVFMVARYEAVTAEEGSLFVMGFDAGNTGDMFQMTSEFGIRIRGGNQLFSSSANVGTFDLLEFSSTDGNATGLQIRLNGVYLQQASISDAPLNTNGDSSLFYKPATNPSNAQYSEGYIAETVTLPATASLEERLKVEGYLAHKWGLAGKLAADHPYKNSAPISDTTTS